MYWKHLSGFLRTAEHVLQGPGRVAGGGCPRVPRRARTAALPGKGSIRTVNAIFAIPRPMFVRTVCSNYQKILFLYVRTCFSFFQ